MTKEIEKYARIDIKTTVSLDNVALVHNLKYIWKFNITKENSPRSIVPKITISEHGLYSNFYTKEKGFFKVIPSLADNNDLPVRYEYKYRRDFCRYANIYKINRNDFTLTILMPLLITYYKDVELFENKLTIDDIEYMVDIDILVHDIIKLEDDYSSDSFNEFFKETREREYILTKLKQPKPPRQKL